MYSYKIRLLDCLFNSYSDCIPTNYEAFKFAWNTGDCVEKWETDVNGNEKIVCCIGDTDLDMDELNNAIIESQKEFLEAE